MWVNLNELQWHVFKVAAMLVSTYFRNWQPTWNQKISTKTVLFQAVYRWMKCQIVEYCIKHSWQSWVTLNDLQQAVDFLILMQIYHVVS